VRSCDPLGLVAALLFVAGCATSETKSLVSRADLPASKYRNVAVFIENLEENEKRAAEDVVASSLQKAGINARSERVIFSGRGAISDQGKASIIQREFDAALFLKVAQKGVIEELVPGAFHDGESISFNHNVGAVVSMNFTTNVGTNMYVLKPDGSVYKPVLSLKTTVELQDAKTAKLVWTSETIASGDARVSNMGTLFQKAAEQTVEKLRADGAI
jgi:hypothetical protein